MAPQTHVVSPTIGKRPILRGAGAVAALAALASTTPAALAQAAPAVLVALTSGNELIRFSSSAPGAVAGRARLSGLPVGEALLGIDFRPATKQLYAVGSSGRIYTLNPLTGAAAQAAPNPLNPAPNGTAFGVDFNPVPDRLRLVSNGDQNLRINVDTAEVVVDGTLAYAASDRNAGANPTVVAAGYTNSVAGATATMLFVIDSDRDVLALQNPPNDGTLNTVGPLGVNTSEITGFDIAPDGNVAYAALTAPGATTSSLYRVNLSIGTASLVGGIGGGQTVRGLAVALDPAAVPLAPAGLPSTGGGPAAALPAVPAAMSLAGLALAGTLALRRRRA